MSAMELSSRDTFFNRHGMQSQAKIETSRENYDGHNLKGDTRSRVLPLDACWREHLTTEVHTRAQSTCPTQSKPPQEMRSPKKEPRLPFHRRIAKAISVRHGSIALPNLPKATLRANGCSNIP